MEFLGLLRGRNRTGCAHHRCLALNGCEVKAFSELRKGRKIQWLLFAPLGYPLANHFAKLPVRVLPFLFA
jgi:hypothetical protein